MGEGNGDFRAGAADRGEEFLLVFNWSLFNWQLKQLSGFGGIFLVLAS